MSTDNRYVVGHTIHTPGRDEPSTGVIPVVYTLRDAIEVCREERARVLPVGTEWHIYRLEPVPGYIESADLATGPDWGGEDPEQREALDRYLESSEELDVAMRRDAGG